MAAAEHMPPRGLLPQVALWLRVTRYFSWFATRQARAFLWTVASRAWFSDYERARNSWPLAVDVAVTAIKAAIEAAPQDVEVIKRFVGSDMGARLRPIVLPPWIGAATVTTVPACARATVVGAALGTASAAAPADVPAEWIVGRGVARPEVQAGNSGKVVLYLHGGAYAFMSTATHRELIARISRTLKAPALAPNYRLAPSAPFPAGLEDAVAAFRHLIDPVSSGGYGFKPDRVVVAGDSAGGGLALALALMLRDAGLPRPACVVTLSGWFDLACRGDSWGEAASRDYLPSRESPLLLACGILYAGVPENRMNPLASPIEADFRGLPPLLLQVGGSERTRADSIAVAERASACGVECRLQVSFGQVHVFQAFAGTQAATTALRRLKTFVAEVVDGVAPPLGEADSTIQGVCNVTSLPHGEGSLQAAGDQTSCAGQRAPTLLRARL